MKDLCVKMVRGLMVLLSKLPLKFHYFMGDILSWIVKNVLRYRNGLVIHNLARSFPELRYRDVRKIYDGFYVHFGELVAETIWFGGCSYARLNKAGIVKVMNAREVSEIFESTPSMTVLSTHCGNWELLGGLPGYTTADGCELSVPETAISVVYKEMSNWIADRVFALNRIAPLEKVGTECEVESSKILRVALRNKDVKSLYIYIADQFPYVVTHYSAGEFLHQQTLAMLGSAGVAHKLGHSVIYMKMRRSKMAENEILEKQIIFL